MTTTEREAAGQEDLQTEQDYFDAAQAAREASRATLLEASKAGGSNKERAAIDKKIKAKLEELGEPSDAVAVGKITFLDDDEPLYIGKRAILNDDKDVLVIGWHAPVAEKYYKASHQDPMGLAAKRTFETTDNRIERYEDTVFAEIAERISELSAAEQWGISDALLGDLEQKRDGAMRDIVKTIQHAQYDLIAQPLERLLIIQGGPGTGKTAVALHRVSWLLANHRSLAADGVLVIGPSPTFTRYIRKVLPELGDIDVQHRHLRELGPLKSGRLEEPRATAKLKGERKMADLLARGLRDRVRVPAGVESLRVGGITGPAFPREEVEAELNRHVGRTTYSIGRTNFRTWIQHTAERRARRGFPVTATDVESLVERVWPQLSPQAFLRDLLGSRERLLTAATSEFTATDITALQRTPTPRVTDQEWSDADIALLDEAEHLLNGTARTYQHIVVDEAQDLSPMQLRSIRRRSATGSMTVVGDIAQATSPWAAQDWSGVQQALASELPTEVRELQLGYRVPRQIYQHAANLLPLAAPGVTAPRIVRDGPAEPDFITTSNKVGAAVRAAQEHAGKGRFVGVICGSADRAALAEALTADDVNWGDVGAGDMDVSINLATAEQSKGLEFDAVVVLDPTQIAAEGEHGMRLLYIALTRSTAYLTVVQDEAPLPETADTVDHLDQVELVSVADEPPAAPEPAAAQGADAGKHGRGVTNEPGSGAFGEKMAAMAAEQLAADLASAVAPSLWGRVLELLPEYLPTPSE